MAELDDRMKQLGVTPELLHEWQDQEDEGFVGAGLGSLHDLARYADQCEILKQAQEPSARHGQNSPFPLPPNIVEKTN